ncbi:hypothetical protein HAV38_12845 [Glaciimonas immobilis]|nr:hypothetical protein [Glaciimonas immobilis]KAF3997559.1 hypothetical protein HAV38_12845 [Glaciimonas immobilis]
MEQVKHMMDGISVMAVLTSFSNIFPAVLSVLSACLAIVWYWIRITEYLKSKKVISDDKIR